MPLHRRKDRQPLFLPAYQQDPAGCLKPEGNSPQKTATRMVLPTFQFDISTNIETMEAKQLTELDAIAGLGALAQPSRLRAFRALVVAGQQGLTAGALAQQLDVPPVRSASI